MTGLRLHHIGYLVEDLSAATERWVNVLGYEVDGDAIHDAGQQAVVQLLRQPGAAHWFELISPDSPNSHLHKALQRKVTLHHHAYEALDMDNAIAQLRSAGCFPLGKSAIGAAFQRPIMWFMDPQCGLLELVAAGDGSYQLS